MGTRNGLIAFSLKRLCCSDLIQLRRRLFSHYLLENSSSRTVFLSEVTPPSLFIHPHLSVCIHISFCQSPLINYQRHKEVVVYQPINESLSISGMFSELYSFQDHPNHFQKQFTAIFHIFNIIHQLQGKSAECIIRLK